MEILLVLALLGMLAGLGIAAAGSLFGERTAHNADVLWNAVDAARSRAVAGDVSVRLRIAEDGRSLHVESLGATEIFSLVGGAVVQLAQTGLPDGTASYARKATDSIRSVRFYPDGTCDAFQMEVRPPAGVPVKLAVDPWTGAAVPVRAEP